MDRKKLFAVCLTIVRLNAMDSSIFEPSRSPIGSPTGMSEFTYVCTYFKNACTYIENGQLEDLSGAFTVLERSINAMTNEYMKTNFLLSLAELTVEAIHHYPQFMLNIDPHALLSQAAYRSRYIDPHNLPLACFLSGYFTCVPAETYHSYATIVRNNDINKLTPIQQAHVYAWLTSYFASIPLNGLQATFAKECYQRAYQARNLLNPAMKTAVEAIYTRINPTAHQLPTSPAWRPTELALTGLTLQM